VTTATDNPAIQRELDRRPGYDVASVPPAPDRERSRFALITRSPSGIETTGARNLGNCASLLAQRYLRDDERALPETVTVRIQKLYELADGGGVVARPWPRLEELTRVPRFTNKRPTKLGQLGDATAAEVIDSFLLGESPGWDNATDAEIFRAGAEVANIEALSGEALSNFSAALARMVAARAGIELTGADIP
jgi:hypothetical protein